MGIKGLGEYVSDAWQYVTGDVEPLKNQPSVAKTDVYCKDEKVAPTRLDGTPMSRVPAPGAAKTRDLTKLRAAFDALPGPSSTAMTYRLDENNGAFASRWKTLEGAKKTFDTTYFIWNADVFGYAYLGHMFIKAKEQGLSIRGMLDATGDPVGTNFKTCDDVLQELVSLDPSRVQFGIYNPVLKKEFGEGLAAMIASNHDKLAIADRRVVETGGRNMATHYFADPRDEKGVYRDTDVNVESETAGKLATAAFDREFNASFTRKVQPDGYGNWNSKEAILVGAYVMMDQWLKAPALNEKEKQRLRSDKNFREQYVDDVMKGVESGLKAHGVTASFLETCDIRELAEELVHNTELRGEANTFKPQKFSTEVKILDNTSAAHGANRMEQINDSLIRLSEVASESIVIHNPYVVLTDKAIAALAKAADRGVQVIFGTNSPESSDSAVTQAFFLEDWADVMAKVRNSRVIVARGDEKHHSKTFVIDGAITGISSFNADWISARVNSEDVAVMWGEDFATDTLTNYIETVADPRHKVVEYKIQRDPDGRAVIKDGRPIIEYGADCHVPAAMMKKYIPLRRSANRAREKLNGLAPLKKPTIDPAKDYVRVQ